MVFAWRLDGGAFTDFSATSTASLTGLAIGSHTFDVKARDRAGNEDPTPATQTFTVTSLQIAISQPLAGATVPAGMLVVRGSVSAAGAEVGVTVNGMPAAVQGNAFAVLLPVDASTTTLTATAALASGATASQSVGIAVSGTVPSIELRPNPTSGASPLNVSFSLIASLSVASLELDFDGNGTVDFSGSGLAGQTFTYATPGLYVPTVAVTDDQGNRAVGNAIVQVLDRANFDAFLQAKWAAFRTALGQGNIAAALTYIVVGEQPKYRTAFQNLVPDLPQIASTLRGIVLVSLSGGIAEYATTQDRDGGTFVHFVYFMLDGDGLWKIVAM